MTGQVFCPLFVRLFVFFPLILLFYEPVSSTSTVIKKIQNKMTVKCHFIFIRLAKLSKNDTLLKLGEDVE